MEVAKPKKHIILVHGACHGAWSWFKVKPLLEASDHKVTTLDLSASGRNAKKIEEVYSLHDYTIPLLEALESLPPNEKVILVGHSLGGLNLALAMDKYPGKISVAVFLAAFIPDTDHVPAYVLNEYANRTPPKEWLDTQFKPYKTPGGEPLTSMFFGPEFLKSKLYQLCSAEDVELAKTLVRPGSLFVEDLAKANNFSKEGFGSVKRVYIICNEDKGIPEEFQRWMIENSGVRDVMEIKDADHMVMLSKPQELLQSLLKIANKYD